MNDNRIRAAARKALMTADPLYYAWLPEQQERFRATMDDVASDKVAAILLRELLDISCTADNAGDIWSDLPLSQLEHINWAKLLATGIGEDMIWLNESMAENVSLLDFDTLHETHRDIIQNFDPTVIRLRKKRKVVVAPGAFDSLLQLDEDNHRQ